MKSLIYLFGGFAAVTAYFLIVKNRSEPVPPPVVELAHKLQDAWADHHTVV